jgi:hypothetical protein
VEEKRLRDEHEQYHRRCEFCFFVIRSRCFELGRRSNWKIGLSPAN